MHWYQIPDPFALPLNRFFRLLDGIVEIQRLKSGTANTPEAFLERLLR